MQFGDKKQGRGRVQQIVFVVLIFAFVLLPVLNSFLLKKDAAPLMGVDNEYTLPAFSARSFLSGDYQAQFEDSFSHGFSGYSLSMRTLNELRYQMFDQAGDKVVCKDGSVIFESYLQEYLGLSPVYNCSDEYLDNLAAQLTKINALAKANGKLLSVVVTPNKADFVTDQIPDRYLAMERLYEEQDRGIYRLLDRLADTDISVVNSADILRARDWPFDLFPQTGIHWTREAGLQAFDALLDTWEDAGDWNLKRIAVSDREYETTPRRTSLNNDDDLWLLMNVFSKLDTRYSYPVEEELIPEKYDLPAVFVQGGSYSYTLCELLADHDIAKDVNFLFYAQSLYDYEENMTPVQSFYDEAIAQKVRESDIILLEVNEQAVNNMGAGFYPVLQELLAQNPSAAENGDFQVQFRGFAPWETANDVSWRWAYGNNAMLVFENTQPDDALEVNFWVPYSYYTNDNGPLTEPITLEVYLNSSRIQELTCNGDEIFTVRIPAEKLIHGQDNIVEIRCPYTFKAMTSGEKEVSVQVLSAGRAA